MSITLWGYNTLTTISGYHLTTNATVTQQSTPKSVKKTHPLWHAWDVTSSSLSLRPESECLSTHSVGTAYSTSEQSSLDASISPGCTLFRLADHTAFVYMDSYLHRWKSSISAASIYEKTASFHRTGSFISTPLRICSMRFCYCVYFDICPSTRQSVCFDTYSIVIVLTSGPAVGWINTSVSCLVKLPLWCCNYITLVPLVLWAITMTSTPLQLSWLVDRHGVGLLSLCFGWTIPKRMVVDPWSTGFAVFSFMVIYLFHHPFCWKGWRDHDEDCGFGWWLPQWHEVVSPKVVKKKWLVETLRVRVIVARATGCVLWCCLLQWCVCWECESTTVWSLCLLRV